MKWKLSQNAVRNAGSKLPRLAEKYFQAGRKAVDKENTPKRLHAFRLKTKRFRYALELFTPIYGPSLDRHLASLRGIQDALGKVSDYQTIRELLGEDKKLEAKVEKAQRKKITEFRNEWKKLDANGQLERWKAYLAHVPPANKRAAPPVRPTKKRVLASENSQLPINPMLE